MSASRLNSFVLVLLIYQLVIAVAVRNNIYDYAGQRKLVKNDHKLSSLYGNGAGRLPYALPAQQHRYVPNAKGLFQHNPLMGTSHHHFMPPMPPLHHRIPSQPYKGYRKKRKVLYRFVPHYNGLIINFKPPSYLPDNKNSNRFNIKMLNTPLMYSALAASSNTITFTNPVQSPWQLSQPSQASMEPMVKQTPHTPTNAENYYLNMQQQQKQQQHPLTYSQEYELLKMHVTATTTQKPLQHDKKFEYWADQWIPIANNKETMPFRAFAAPDRETAISPLNSHEPITSYKPVPFPTAMELIATTIPPFRPAQLIRSTATTATATSVIDAFNSGVLTTTARSTTRSVLETKKTKPSYEFHPITAYDSALSFGSLMDSFYTTQRQAQPIKNSSTTTTTTTTTPSPTTTAASRFIAPQITESFLDYWLGIGYSRLSSTPTPQLPPTHSRGTVVVHDNATTIATVSPNDVGPTEPATTVINNKLIINNKRNSPMSSLVLSTTTSTVTAAFVNAPTKKRKYFYAKKFPTSLSYARNTSTTTTTVAPPPKLYKKSAALMKQARTARPNKYGLLPRLRIKPTIWQQNSTSTTDSSIPTTNIIISSSSEIPITSLKPSIRPTTTTISQAPSTIPRMHVTRGRRPPKTSVKSETIVAKTYIGNAEATANRKATRPLQKHRGKARVPQQAAAAPTKRKTASPASRKRKIAEPTTARIVAKLNVTSNVNDTGHASLQTSTRITNSTSSTTMSATVTTIRGRSQRTSESAIMKINKICAHCSTRTTKTTASAVQQIARSSINSELKPRGKAASSNAIPELPIEVYFKQLGSAL